MDMAGAGLTMVMVMATVMVMVTDAVIADITHLHTTITATITTHIIMDQGTAREGTQMVPEHAEAVEDLLEKNMKMHLQSDQVAG